MHYHVAAVAQSAAIQLFLSVVILKPLLAFESAHIDLWQLPYHDERQLRDNECATKT